VREWRECGRPQAWKRFWRASKLPKRKCVKSVQLAKKSRRRELWRRRKRWPLRQRAKLQRHAHASSKRVPSVPRLHRAG
jgi:hypothetical protein